MVGTARQLGGMGWYQTEREGIFRKVDKNGIESLRLIGTGDLCFCEFGDFRRCFVPIALRQYVLHVLPIQPEGRAAQR